ncbi:MAG: FtsX-like permease family protein, partial [Gemmatimonadetes bacterium]|nr:FtsX-like permease family protein [Gemmatimonadota bacterium]
MSRLAAQTRFRPAHRRSWPIQRKPLGHVPLPHHPSRRKPTIRGGEEGTMVQAWQDVRFALRAFRKGWGVTTLAVVSLAVAIGGNAAVFSIISSFFLQPITVEEPERLVATQERRKEQPQGPGTLATSLALYADLAERSRTTAGWAAYRPVTFGLRGTERAEPVSAAQVTAGIFPVLGVRPERGRAFRDEEAVEGAPRVALVRPEWWQRTHGDAGDPLGQILTLDSEPYEIVGVLPVGLTFLFTTADIWVPLTDDPRASPRDRRDVLALARLAPSATMEQVISEIGVLGEQLGAEHPEVQRDWRLEVFNVREDIPGGRTVTYYALLQGSVFFVLLIACANIANLLLARGLDRRREIALRSVLGAGRGRIVRQLLTESGLLVSAGALLGLALGWYGIRAIAARWASVLPATYQPVLDGRVVGFTMGVSMLAGVLFGVVPAFQACSDGQAEALKEGGRMSGGRSRQIISRGLVVAEVALSLLALGGGGMLVRAFLSIRGEDPGFDGSSLVTAQVNAPASRYPDDGQRIILQDRLLDRARSLVGAEAAALVNVLPRNVQAPTDTFRVAGR